MLEKERVEQLAPAGEGRVNVAVYTDEQVFREEMDTIFHTTWLYLGHDSEVAQPGDFKTAYMGVIPVFLTRDDSGELFVFLDRCPGCGSTVAQTEYGNSRAFHCMFHDWHFDNRGQLAGLDVRLDRLARVGSYRGLIFAALATEGPAHDEYLGLARQYIDDWADQSPSGEVQVRAGAFKQTYNGNWKLAIEAGNDGYRAMVRRETDDAKTVVDATAVRERDPARPEPKAIDLGNGHSVIERLDGFDPDASGYSPGYVAMLTKRLGRERALRLLGANGWRLQLFPNVAIGSGVIRVVRPINADSSEVLDYHVMLADAPEDLDTDRMADFQRVYGPTGPSADDFELFAQMHEGYRSAEAGSLNQWALFTRGLTSEVAGPSGERIGHVTSELPQRAIYRAWSALMQGQSQVTATDAVIPTTEAAAIAIVPE